MNYFCQIYCINYCVITVRMRWLMLMLVSATAKYHSTETLLNQVQQHCHGPLTCRFEGDVTNCFLKPRQDISFPPLQKT